MQKINPSLQKIYSDLDLTFQPNPVTGDVSLSYDANAVVRSVRYLLLTNFYDRVFQPNVGSNVTAHLFELATAATAASLQSEILDVIKNFEPRVSGTICQVVAMPDQNQFLIQLQFFIGNNTQPSNISLILQRTR